MSDQPPPFSGPNYAQQWPPYPSMLPPNFSTPSEHSAMNSQPTSAHGTPFDYNMASVNANSQIPGLGGPANSAAFFPPQFPFFNQFDPSQFPPAFPPMPFAPMGYPPVPIPTESSDAPFPQQWQIPPHSQQSSIPAVRSRPSKAIPIRAESSREEGEVREAQTRRTLRQYSDLEEGETVSSSGRSSRRSSGSPYNPPLSVSADPGIIDHAMAAQKPVPQPTTPAAQPTKSLAQLRIQAQGALLSLAPHHIRYKELVAEGINPIILKRLYDEVGIKVILPTEQAPLVPGKAPVTNAPRSSHAADPAPLVQATPSAAKSNVSGSQAASPASPQSKDSKPLERKELIARMLAAKVAKAASMETSPAGSTNSAPTPDEVRPPQKEPKAKSKAQTELAKQRIEELKQKALLKSQKKVPESPAPVLHESLAPAIHHPLPVRPPLPDLHHSAGLPGLFMTGLDQGPNVVADPTPVSRATHRKRPLASDFDEPVAPLKKHFNPTAGRFNPADRLIIAISDDESLYGDDEDDNMELDSGSEQEPTTIVSSIIAKPSAQPYITTTRASTSTPQAPSSSNDQGEIRTKDMEIQAMRRKIAELELRRKSKLAASRTQSPRTADDSGASTSSAQSSAADLGAVNASVAPSSHMMPDADTSEEDSTAAGISLAPRGSIPPVASLSAPEALAGLHTNGEPHQKSLVDTMTNGTVHDTARASDSFESDSAGSAMDESDDSSSDGSDSSSEDEDEPSSSPAQIDVHPPIVPELSEPMDIDSSEQSVSRSSPSAVTQPSSNSVEGGGSQRHQSEQSQRESSVESEAYEPPEPDTEAQSEGSSYSPPPFSPAPPDPVETTAVSAPSFEIAQTTEELTNTPQVSGPSSQTDLQVGALGTETSSANSAHKFTPYTSPLRTFKAYRYHPNYAADVPSGYRSLTYSHNIDSMKYFCPYEVAGGVCNDRSCEFQHLRDMTLSDDNILIQMGAAREGQTEEEKETYLAGLKEIINDLRRDKVKDFNTVAAEIAAYRRRFLQDPSRVLSL